MKHRKPAVSDMEKKKLTIIADYIHCKGGVDNLDKVGAITHQLLTHLLILAEFMCLSEIYLVL